ncbi:MAG TPA: hypothetical protein VF292_03050 [Rhodanobacteraceae bacterium]
MSYARFSSDDYQCDVYVYESVDGWVTHTALRRYVLDGLLPPPVPFDEGHLQAFIERQVKVSAIVEHAQQTLIELPNAGESFRDPTPLACAQRLERLKAIGFRVPQYAIDALRDEAREAQGGGR